MYGAVQITGNYLYAPQLPGIVSARESAECTECHVQLTQVTVTLEVNPTALKSATDSVTPTARAKAHSSMRSPDSHMHLALCHD
eukprot:g36869.t1